MSGNEYLPVEGGDPERYRVTFDPARTRAPEGRGNFVLGLGSLPVRFTPGARRGA